eukprot:CAMPEP_0178425346 /NCGR_PEP_ID=MMETSP0689_2-20121128/28674_1 /TAXON_ID=160604 /ORGANISM="Amphidinium massartii, Strain CS-259" /LENGTH=419 /DNA_ID=CAMNT_0020047003 /DNA_START=42 /DNA_END=1297 /DNA_ORIENTATION=-
MSSEAEQPPSGEPQEEEEDEVLPLTEEQVKALAEAQAQAIAEADAHAGLGAVAVQLTMQAGEEAEAEVDFIGEVSWDVEVTDTTESFDIDLHVLYRSPPGAHGGEWKTLAEGKERHSEGVAHTHDEEAKDDKETVATLLLKLSNAHSYKNAKTVSLRIAPQPGSRLVSSRLPAEEPLRNAVAAALAGTYLKRDEKLPADTLKVLQVQRIQDDAKLREYTAVLQDISSRRSDEECARRITDLAVKTEGFGLPSCFKSCGESWLFHGTSADSVDGIVRTGFDISGSAGSRKKGTIFGTGVYFAECASKADLYSIPVPHPSGKSEVCCMLLCRVALGRYIMSQDLRPDGERLQSLVKKGEYDSVVGDRERLQKSYREFVVQSSDAIYPDFIIKYERVEPTVFQRWRRYHFGETNFFDSRIDP